MGRGQVTWDSVSQNKSMDFIPSDLVYILERSS